jgi:selenocysteine lyase/cysteine desulfurase
LASKWRPRPLLFGGTGTVSESIQMPEQLPSAYEAGSHNICAIAGLHAALGWLQENGREVIVAHTMNLGHQLHEVLAKYPKIELFTPPKDMPWCGILSFTTQDTSPQSIEMALGAQNIAVRAGLHCAPWTHEWLETKVGGGTVRISVGNTNSMQQIELSVAIIDYLAS